MLQTFASGNLIHNLLTFSGAHGSGSGERPQTSRDSRKDQWDSGTQDLRWEGVGVNREATVIRTQSYSRETSPLAHHINVYLFAHPH